MILNYTLTKENKESLCLDTQEEIYYCVPSDIDLSGNYRNNSFLIMTN